MTENEQCQYLLQYLLKENSAYSTLKIPDAPEERKRLLRSLMNMRPPAPAEQEFLAVQDAYLTGESLRKGIVSPDDLRPLEPGLGLWQGDITTLRADAIVNAANSALLGCFTPLPRLHRQRHPFGGGSAAAADLSQHHAAAGRERACRQGKNHVGLQSPLPLGPAHRRSHHQWNAYKGGPSAPLFLLPLLPGARGRPSSAKHRLLLHLHRGIPFPKRGGGAHRRPYRKGIPPGNRF